LGHPDNYILSNPVITPLHIVPEWYFLPFYAILRACPDKLGGVMAMAFSLIVLVLMPTRTSTLDTKFDFGLVIIKFILFMNFIFLG